MKIDLAARSLILFGVSFLVVLGLTVFESALVGTSTATQRLITLLGIVLPAGAGAVLGVLSLVRRDGRAWLAVTAILLNTAFALFYLAIVLFAG
jgi:hypothetical protein